MDRVSPNFINNAEKIKIEGRESCKFLLCEEVASDFGLGIFIPWYLFLGMSSIVDKSTFSLCQLNRNRMVGYRIVIINILYPNNGL